MYCRQTDCSKRKNKRNARRERKQNQKPAWPKMDNSWVTLQRHTPIQYLESIPSVSPAPRQDHPLSIVRYSEPSNSWPNLFSSISCRTRRVSYDLDGRGYPSLLYASLDLPCRQSRSSESGRLVHSFATVLPPIWLVILTSAGKGS